MKNKKNIDRLFQERFKDFETEPNEQIWLNIKSALKEEKKERRVIPLWLKYTGIAAAFFLGFFTLNPIFNTTKDSRNSIVLENKSSTTKNDSQQTKPKEENNTINPENSSKLTLTDRKKTNKDETENTNPTQTKTQVGKATIQNIATVYYRKNNQPLKQVDYENQILKSDLPLVEKRNVKNTNSTEDILNKKGHLLENIKSDIAENNSEKLHLIAPDNELEALLKAKEEAGGKIVVPNKNKWEITPNIAALFPQTNSNGSSIDPQFSENTKSTDNNIGFGVGIKYAISNKVTLRSGINKFSLGFNTDNIVYSSGLKSTNLANVNYTTETMIEVLNNTDLNSLMSFEKDLQKTSSGTINQKMGYYEVPLEISYAILDKKIGVSIIGGVSTLFLEENKISLMSTDTNLKLGEANNLNTVHFSTNFGLGFKYKFARSFQFSFEPMVKYQLNTFTNNSASFKPVLMGLYSGISYHF